MSDCHTQRTARWRGASLAACLLLTLLWLGTRAAADPNHDGEQMEEAVSPSPSPSSTAAREPTTPSLELRVPAEAELGEAVRLEAMLLSDRGRPLVGQRVTFFAEAAWSDELRGEMVLGTAFTDEAGMAAIVTDLRTAGELSVGVRFAGNPRFAQADAMGTIAVGGDRQLYTPETRLRLPPGAWWLLVLVAAVWGTYLLVARQVLGVARAGAPARSGDEPGADRAGRRHFLGAFVLPAGLMTAVGSLGSGLLTLIVRSPRTHGNREASGWHTGSLRHRVTPVARVGAHRDMRPMPEILERAVSFNDEILPILLQKGGPHSHPSAYSPPPHDVRLDSYAAIMRGGPDAHAEEGKDEEPDAHEGETSEGEDSGEPHEEEGAHGHRLVEPGKPGESMLVTMLLSPAHQMPPSVPLTDEEIQLIASWVAQGAKNT